MLAVAGLMDVLLLDQIVYNIYVVRTTDYERSLRLFDRRGKSRLPQPEMAVMFVPIARWGKGTSLDDGKTDSLSW